MLERIYLALVLSTRAEDASSKRYSSNEHGLAQVGFYQMSKLACIPVTLLVSWLANGEKASAATLSSLVPLVAGLREAACFATLGARRRGTVHL